jgi:hypothetical protein
LGRLGWSLRRIQQETGVRRETASVYLKAAGIQVPPPGRRKQREAKPAISVTTGSGAELVSPNPNPSPNPENLPNRGKAKTAKPAIEVTTGFGVELSSVESENRAPAASACEPFREAIELGLSRGRNAMAIWQDLVADAGFSGSSQTVKRFVRKLHRTQPAQSRAVILTAPGEEAQVDYGSKGPMVRDAQTGKYRRTRLFVMTLGYSRKAVRLLISSTGRQYPCRGPGQLQRRCTDPRHLRSHCEPAISRCARSLRGGGPALSDPRSRSQGFELILHLVKYLVLRLRVRPDIHAYERTLQVGLPEDLVEIVTSIVNRVCAKQAAPTPEVYAH